MAAAFDARAFPVGSGSDAAGSGFPSAAAEALPLAGCAVLEIGSGLAAGWGASGGACVVGAWLTT